MSRLIDISRTISPDLVVWPGDSTFSFRQIMDITTGASVNLTTLTLSAHTGTHADAPWHTEAEGAHPAAVPLTPYLGPAHVVRIERRQGGITPADLVDHNLEGLERLLIHTWVSHLEDDAWPADFPYLTVELVDWLAERGVLLVGVDMPSVDAFSSMELPCHHRLAYHRIANLEMLCLKDAPDGVYELAALPLKIDGVCGSPVRAVLRTMD